MDQEESVETTEQGTDSQAGLGDLGEGSQETETSEVKENPAWSPYLDKFPDQVRHIAKETFSEWDRGVQQRFQAIHDQYKPFKPFMDQGVDPEKLNSAWGIAQMLEENPQGFARILAEQLGMTVQEAVEATEDLKEQGASGEDEDVDPRLKELQEQQQLMYQMIQQDQQERQQERLVEEQGAAIAKEFGELEQKHGALSDVIKNQVLREALRMMHETGKPVSLHDAWSSLDQFVAAVRRAPSKTSPRVLPNNGGIPKTEPKKPGERQAQDRKAMVAEMLARNNAQ